MSDLLFVGPLLLGVGLMLVGAFGLALGQATLQILLAGSALAVVWIIIMTGARVK